MNKFLLLLAFCGLFTTNMQAQCDSAYSELRLELQPDQYFNEVSWRVSNAINGDVYFIGNCLNTSFVSQTYCVPNNECIEFKIIDDYGDGIAPTGFYKLFLNDSLIFENLTGTYNYSESYTFNCPPGSNCGSSYSITEGEHFTSPNGSETWYSFTPDQNGIYNLSTCYPENTCPTKLWVYGTECQFITVTNNILGTLFYNTNGCPDSIMAQANLLLAGGNTYYIRLGYAETGCDTAAIKFSLTYAGAISGCTDSLACNYNPLATISADCIYPGNPDCPNAPDLVVLEQPLLNTLSQSVYQNVDACAVEEGCLRGFGQRALIEFTTHIQNTGEEDYYIGQTPTNPNTPSDQFVWDPCHNHWHYRGYAEYVLFDEQGTLVPVGAKNGFCVLDLECNNGGNGKYSCFDMGISAGCGDIYDKGLPCQWIDITDLPAGTYTFVVRVNWDKSPDKNGRLEKSYENNWAQACFTLAYGANGAPDVEFITDCPVYTDCTGEAFGNAQPDCEGECAGPALIGDWDKNLLREMEDVNAYMTVALPDTSSLTDCREIYADGHFDVYDAALLQECILHENDPSHWGTRFACQFPTGSQNPNDLVYFNLGTLDTMAQTLDVMITNPSNKILGYEIEISGLVIDSLENLATGFDAVYQHNTKRIIALSQTEQPISKNLLATNVLRIHYSTLTALTVCVDSVIAVVNDKYVRSNATPGTEACITGIVSGTDEFSSAIRMQLMPNPAQSQVNLYFANPRLLRTQIQLTDLNGKVVRSYNGIRDSELLIPRNDLPAGIYQVKISNEEGTAVGRLVWQ